MLDILRQIGQNKGKYMVLFPCLWDKKHLSHILILWILCYIDKNACVYKENLMDSTERVRRAIQGEEIDRQPIYGWVSANLEQEISDVWGSVAAFEDRYEFDMAHLFGGPGSFKGDVLERIQAENEEMMPDLLVEEDIFDSPDRPEDYKNLEEALRFHKERGRFCYVQTPGFFEQFNGVFGIENQLLYLAMYPEELG